MSPREREPWLSEAQAERFALGEALGQGAGGTVWAAWDRLLGREVALKRLRPTGAVEAARARREVAALLALDLPGVVRLLDQLPEPDGALLVMERVRGAPFPDLPGRGWAELAPRVRALLRALEAVHASGLVHRDLKPDNALVTADGQVVLLDFGLAVGAAAGERVTRAGGVVGTPRYLAPEQLTGEPVDGRADLYALGVMLYEHLAGAPPHAAERLSELWVSRLTRDPPSLGRARPDLPDEVVALVDRLLARAPEARWPSAGAVLAALGGEAALGLPWLGDAAALASALEALQAGGGVRLGGPPGSGPGRALRELAAGLGARAWRLPAGARPFESLGAGEPPTERDDAGAVAWAAEALDRALADGRIPLAGAEADPWTLALLAERRVGAIVVDRDADWILGPVAALDLERWFERGGCFLHLAQDAAEALHRESGGWPARAAACARRWLAEGLARQGACRASGATGSQALHGGRLAVDRAALGRIAERDPVLPAAAPPILPPRLEALREAIALAGPGVDAHTLARALCQPLWEVSLGRGWLVEIGALVGDRVAHACDGLGRDPERRRGLHAALGAALPAGAPGRHRHLVAGLDAAGAAAEAPAAAQAALDQGRVDRAVAILRATLRLCQAEGVEPDAVLGLLVGLLAGSADATSRRVVDYELARAAPAPALRSLVEAWRHVHRGQPREALAILDGLGPLEGRPARSALSARSAAAQQLPVGEHAALLEGLLRAAPAGGPFVALREGWRGLLAYRQGRFAEAAAHHRAAADARAEPAGRLASWLNAANSALEAGQLDLAHADALQAGALAAALRDAVAEARAAVIARSVKHRLRQPVTPDLAFVDEVAAAGAPALEGTVAAAEAALAWRLGDRPGCRALASRATACFEATGIRPARLYARALAVAAGEGSEQEAEQLAEDALACPLPEVALDVLALMVSRVGARRDWAGAGRGIAARTDASTWGIARGVYTVPEALGILGGVRWS